VRFLANIKTSHLVAFAVAFLVPLLQVQTLWFFDGERVDENYLYLFSVGFFGGDFDPHWYHYGTLGMYLLYGVYMSLYGVLHLTDRFATLDDYAMQAFYNGFFVLSARYLFAVIGVTAILLYARLARLVRISWPLIAAFLLVAFTSRDAIYAANYLRTDQLVGFFIALAIWAACQSRKPVFLYALAIATAGAISSKPAALPIIMLLGGTLVYRRHVNAIPWRHMLGSVVVCVICLRLFQPYMDYIGELTGLFQMGLQGVGGGGEGAIGFNWGKILHYTALARVHALWTVFADHCTLPVLLSLPLLLFIRPFPKIAAPALLALALLVLPYLNSPEITFYWFLPAFNVVRFLSLLAVAGVCQRAAAAWQDRWPGHNRRQIAWTQGTVLALVLVFLVIPNLRDIRSTYVRRETNLRTAQRWIEQNLARDESVLLDGMLNHVMPQIYNEKNLKMAKIISHSFQSNRGHNPYLHRLFEDYLQHHYGQHTGLDTVKEARYISAFDPADSNQVERIQGKYFITSPIAYHRYLNRGFEDLSEENKNKLMRYQAYYRYMLTNPLTKEFSSGREHAIEIYHITVRPDPPPG